MSSKKRIAKLKAEVADIKSVELTRLYNTYGSLKPSTVVEEARAESSPLHGDFEWEDGKAAHQHRLHQARTLIRVHFLITDKGRETIVHVPPVTTSEPQEDAREGEYHPISVVVQNVDMFGRALSELESKLHSAERACDDLRMAAETSGNPDQIRMAQIAMAMTAIKAASDVVKLLH